MRTKRAAVLTTVTGTFGHFTFVSDNTDTGHTNFCYSNKHHVSILVSNIKQTFKQKKFDPKKYAIRTIVILNYLNV